MIIEEEDKMRVIDFHTHIDDILYGGDLVEPYSEMVWTPGDIFEWSGYRVSGLKGLFHKLSHHLEVLYIHHRMQFGTKENLARFMERYGVEKSVLLPIAPLTDGLRYLRKVKGDGRFIVFASVSPYDSDKERHLKAQVDGGCVGIKLHPILQNASAEHKGYFEIMELARGYKLPVIFHSGVISYYPAYQWVRYGYGEPRRYEKLISGFRDLRIILAHLGMRQWEQVLDLGRRYDNVYVDGSNQRLSVLKKAVLAFGKERMLFGSDFPASHQSTPIKIGLKLTEGDDDFRERFFYKNALSLLSGVK